MTASRPQPRRHALHAATAVLAWAVLKVPAGWVLPGLVLVLAVPLSLDAWRLAGGKAQVEALLPGIYKQPEPLVVSGATLLAGGFLLAASLFPPVAAAGGMVALALGDPAAALAGRWYGRRRHRSGKTWVGSVACFGAATLGILMIPHFGLPAAAAGGAMAALVERRAGPLDNVLIPVAVAMLLGLWVPTGS